MNFSKAIETLRFECRRRHHRGVISLSGDKPWAQERLEEIREACKNSTLGADEYAALVISSDASLAQANDKLIESKEYRSSLGTQHRMLIWDAFDGLEPDAFAAATGVVEGGGLLILLTPLEQEFLSKPDESYLSIAEAHELPRYTNYCLKRFWSKLKDCDLHLHLGQAENPVCSILTSDQTDAQPARETLQLNSEQEKCLEQITHVLQGHRHRPLVIRADRGRGKSTVLAFAAAQAVEQNTEQHVIVVVNKSDSLDVLLKHFQLRTALNSSAQDRLKVWAIDALLEKLPPASCILVDEAASFPLPLLEKLLSHYPRLVFASTLHGYEGSGRGFGLKFDELLHRHCDTWKTSELTRPVRWAENDPLEQLTFDAFVLNAELPQLTGQSSTTNTKIRWYRGEELYQNDQLTQQIFALLVLAHYQTRPSDLRLMLDHPKVHIACLSSDELLGAALCIEEGGEYLSAYPEVSSSEILSGKRRPKGHLVAQSLAVFNQNSAWLDASSLRVMRIAIHPQARREGLGSELLAAIKSHSAQTGFQFTSVSYGVSRELVGFWAKSGFSTLRLGYKPDASSGTSSLLAIAPNSENDFEELLGEALTTAQMRFFEHFTEGLSRYFAKLAPDTVEAILATCKRNSPQLSQRDKQAAELFANGTYQVNDAWPMLNQFLIATLSNNQLGAMSVESKRLLILFFLQGRAAKECMEQCRLSGKKALHKALRESTLTALSLLKVD
jgi:tRNA(Met) cytidine acetyltransferase